MRATKCLLSTSASELIFISVPLWLMWRVRGGSDSSVLIAVSIGRLSHCRFQDQLSDPPAIIDAQSTHRYSPRLAGVAVMSNVLELLRRWVTGRGVESDVAQPVIPEPQVPTDAPDWERIPGSNRLQEWALQLRHACDATETSDDPWE